MKLTNRTQWVVTGQTERTKKRFIYAASNADTRKDAIMHHESSVGDPWPICSRRGDKLIQVKIIIPKLK